jgi:histidine triad (HIT) family protein
MEDSIFTKIIKGEIASTKVYEDENTLAFLDHNPKVPGHTLVIPKKQVVYVWDLSEEDYQALMSSVKKVAQRIKQVLQPKYVGMQVEGIAVPHAHVHVFPFNNSEEYQKIPTPGESLPESELTEMGQKLAF